jgi:hypothetical protein
MPLDDIRWVLEQTRFYCAANGLAFSGYPMHFEGWSMRYRWLDRAR